MEHGEEVKRVLEVLGEIHDPCSVYYGIPLSIVEMGMIRQLHLHNDEATIGLVLTAPDCIFFFDIARKIEDKLRSAGINRVKITILPELWDEDFMSPEARARLNEARVSYASRRGIKIRIKR